MFIYCVQVQEDDVQFRLCRLGNWMKVSNKCCNYDFCGYIVVIHLFFPRTEKAIYLHDKRVSGTFFLIDSLFML